MQQAKGGSRTLMECSSCCTIQDAATKGHLQCLKHLRGKYEFDESLYLLDEWRNAGNWAAIYGHLDCLRYAHENGCPPHKSVCVDAAIGGHLACLRYAHENGFPWDEMTTKAASCLGDEWCWRYQLKGVSWPGRRDCLFYAYENGCP